MDCHRHSTQAAASGAHLAGHWRLAWPFAQRCSLSGWGDPADVAVLFERRRHRLCHHDGGHWIRLIRVVMASRIRRPNDIRADSGRNRDIVHQRVVYVSHSALSASRCHVTASTPRSVSPYDRTSSVWPPAAGNWSYNSGSPLSNAFSIRVLASSGVAAAHDRISLPPRRDRRSSHSRLRKS